MGKELSDLAKYLREIKRASGFSLGDLSAALQRVGKAGKGTSRQYLSMLMNGQIKDPSPEILADLAVALSALANEFESEAFWRQSGVPPQSMDELLASRGDAYEVYADEVQRDRFRDLLKDYSLSSEIIDQVLDGVDDKTITRVLNGEEPLELSLDPTSADVARHRDQGFKVLTLRVDTDKSERETASVPESTAGEYLAKASSAFRRDTGFTPGPKFAASRHMPSECRSFAAGRARIVVTGPITKSQDAVLQALATAIRNLLQEQQPGETS